MDRTQLLAEVEDVIRSMPPLDALGGGGDEAIAWWGRASAVVAVWSPPQAFRFNTAMEFAHTRGNSLTGIRNARLVLSEAAHALRLETVGPLSAAVGQGEVFNYFDGLRKLIEAASSDLLIIDPYLDAEFVSRYLGSVKAGVQVRMLAQKCLSTLIPAAQAFSAQHGTRIQVRQAASWASPGLPDTSTDMMRSGENDEQDKKALHGRVQA